MTLVLKPLAAGGLTFCLFAFLLVELTRDESRLEGGLIRPIGASTLLSGGVARPSSAQRTRAQTKQKSSFVSDLFRKNCARCHGEDGRADTALGHTFQTPDLTDPEWWQKNSKITSTSSLVSIVSRGKGDMPAFGKKLKRTEIRQLVGYARKFKNSRSTNR